LIDIDHSRLGMAFGRPPKIEKQNEEPQSTHQQMESAVSACHRICNRSLEPIALG
jgi:hypothetical protein